MDSLYVWGGTWWRLPCGVQMWSPCCCRVTTRAIFILLCCDRSLTQMSLIPEPRRTLIQSHPCRVTKEHIWLLKGCDLRCLRKLLMLMEESRIHMDPHGRIQILSSPHHPQKSITSILSSCRLVTHLRAPKVEPCKWHTHTQYQRPVQAFIWFTRTLRTASETA